MDCTAAEATEHSFSAAMEGPGPGGEDHGTQVRVAEYDDLQVGAQSAEHPDANTPAEPAPAGCGDMDATSCPPQGHGPSPDSLAPAPAKHPGAVAGAGGALPFEDCYPPRRVDEVRMLRRQRDRLYQLQLLQQMEEKRAREQQRRREEIRADLQRLNKAVPQDEYLSRLQREEQQLLRAQVQAQLQREEQREAQRMQQVEQDREQQLEQFRTQQAESRTRLAEPDQVKDQVKDQVEQLGEQLQRQHLQQPSPRPASESRGAGDGDRGQTREEPHPPSKQPPGSAHSAAEREAATPHIASGVVDQVKLDNRRPWNHYRLLQKELGRRRRERAALEAAREAAAARQAEISGRASMEKEYRRYLDWRQRGRRVGVDAQPNPRMEAARRWAEAKRREFLQQRAAKDSMLAEWRRAKDQQERERRAATTAAQKVEQGALEEKQRRANDSFTCWLAAIHDRKLAENAAPVGATGVTTYEAFHAAPWNKISRVRRKSTAN